MEAAENILPEPRPKQNVSSPRMYPFPIINPDSNIDDNKNKTWELMIGHLQKECVHVHGIENIDRLLSMGFFGRAPIMERTAEIFGLDYSSYNPNRPPLEFPNIQITSSDSDSEDEEIEVVEWEDEITFEDRESEVINCEITSNDSAKIEVVHENDLEKQECKSVLEDDVQIDVVYCDDESDSQEQSNQVVVRKLKIIEEQSNADCDAELKKKDEQVKIADKNKLQKEDKKTEVVDLNVDERVVVKKACALGDKIKKKSSSEENDSGKEERPHVHLAVNVEGDKVMEVKHKHVKMVDASCETENLDENMEFVSWDDEIKSKSLMDGKSHGDKRKRKDLKLATESVETVLLSDSSHDTDIFDETVSSKKKKDCIEEKILELTFEEAFFLSYGLGSLAVKDNDQPLNLVKLWQKLCSLHPRENFPVMYTAYHHFRSKGWVVKNGSKYAVDYVLYKDGPPFYHSTYAIVVVPVKNESLMAATQERAMTWCTLTGIEQLCSQAVKILMFLYVIQPSTLTDNTPNCVSEYKIKEVIVKRYDTVKDEEEDTNVKH